MLIYKLVNRMHVTLEHVMLELLPKVVALAIASLELSVDRPVCSCQRCHHDMATEQNESTLLQTVQARLLREPLSGPLATAPVPPLLHPRS